MERRQKTIKREFSYTGIGLHTGRDVTIKCKPLGSDKGIIFKRVDLEGQIKIEAEIDNVVSTQRCTTIGKDKVNINTIEHLMAAINVLNIDNLLIEIDSNEPPITDGSAGVFYTLLNDAGIKEEEATKEVYQIKEPIYVSEDDQYLVLLPHDEFKVSYTFVSNHPTLEDQFAEFEISKEIFIKEIAPARTFGFAHEVEALQKQGLALGGSLDNAILVGDYGPINDLRFDNEFVRHKILDIIGDMKLAPEFNGHIIGVRSGHRLNSILSKKIKERLF
ncbi:UDP-3-O-acyl-N-acetylglucosamine deacetylase [Halonatronum saccharophilum]|uniref:UDP-3-O-acyl-N-acetylglucosamine deacetylase n=1 Tax=Halonatronum saccharophilum TaxID=150060 RepID=UPI000483DF3F|nr:UDP-3-O-acyl-N-acetylglucosamine deacetylase [Halonatronum saccharophilum]